MWIGNRLQMKEFPLSISDANWGELVRQLDYKAQWYGRELIKIDEVSAAKGACIKRER